MSITIKDDSPLLGRCYNVEYELGNGKIQTFSNNLVNADGKYFWFESYKDGMDIIRQDRVITMTCMRTRYI